MTPESSDTNDVDDDLVEALRNARDRRPWTEAAVRALAESPARLKATANACSACPRPCDRGEVCLTVVAKQRSLFDEMGRRQVYHLLENGTRRLVAKDEADLRREDRPRPNTFVELTDTTHPQDPDR